MVLLRPSTPVIALYGLSKNSKPLKIGALTTYLNPTHASTGGCEIHELGQTHIEHIPFLPESKIPTNSNKPAHNTSFMASPIMSAPLC